MTGISNKPKILYKGTIKYLFGVFFLIMSFGSLGSHGYIAGLFFFLAAIVTIPPAVNQLEKINIRVNGIAQFFIVFLLVAMAFATFPAIPATTNSTSNNTEMIATSPQSSNGSEVITVPANSTNVVTKNSTPKQNETSTAMSSQTSTSVLENTGKLDILTNPSGATITVDGISKGISPIEGLSVNAGTHIVEAYLSGYSLQKEKVEIANSETKKLFYTLFPETNNSTASTLNLEENEEIETTSTSTSQESFNSTTSETTMQLSESKQKELIKLVEQYYDAKNVEVSFISNNNGLVLVTYRTDSVPSKEKLSADISGILMIANGIARESGIPDANANVIVETMDGTPIGTGTYYPLRETGKMDIDVS